MGSSRSIDYWYDPSGNLVDENVDYTYMSDDFNAIMIKHRPCQMKTMAILPED